MIGKACLFALVAAAPSMLRAQAAHDMSGMAMPYDSSPAAAATPSATKQGGAASGGAPPSRDMADEDGGSHAMDHDMAGMGHTMTAMGSTDHGGAMPALLGPYGMSREASGTSWQPESAPMAFVHVPAGDWMVMLHGNATLVHDDQGGGRGARKTFSQSMLMGMASHAVGDAGTLGLRAMLSLDPLMGKSGYPLLFATGETANGREELIDRQHPHDLFMELSASYAHDLGGGRSLYLYGGLPGEPALGPPTFMHRISGMDDPEAPIGHHWFDSTHITFGVVTAGFSTNTWKVEASAFKGREPDQHRWDIETPKLDSWSVRGFWNPTANLSFQLSTGHIHSPEQLSPDRNEQRTTASVSYNRPLGNDGNWAWTLAWSRKDERPGPVLTGWLGETSLRLKRRHILFARAEHVEEAELFGHSEGADGAHGADIVRVSKLSTGYAYEMPVGKAPVRLALGGLVSAYAYPDRIKPVYGKAGVKSFMLFARLRLADPS